MNEEQSASDGKRLTDAICAFCEPYLLTLEALFDEKETQALSGEEFRARLKKALIAGVIVKRTANLLLLSGEADRISYGDYQLSVKEACDTARFAGYDVSLSATAFLEDTDDAQEAKTVIAAFCAFADALYAHCLEDAHKTEAIQKEAIQKETKLPAVSPDVLLAVKQRIHADMGGVLIASRAYLSEEDADNRARDTLLCHWQRVLRTMRTGEWEEERPDVRGQILAAANAAGVNVTFVTALPAEEEEVRRYIKDASARIVAAVRAGERALSI